MSPRSASALLALLLAACHEEPPRMQLPPPTVTIAHPSKQKVVEWDEYTGRLDAVKTVNLFCQVTGYLKKVNFKDGAEVQQGQVLFEIDARPFEAVRDQAAAQEERAKVQLTLAKSEFERADKLRNSNAISAEEFDKKTQAMREAEAAVRLATATVDAAKLNVEFTKVTAPITGRMGRRLMDEGGLVIGGPMGATLLGTLVSQDPIYCYIDADELSSLKYRRLNREGKFKDAQEDTIPCEMGLANDDGWPHQGVFDFVDNKLNPATGTIVARATFANPKPERGARVLQPGFFARLRVPSGPEHEVLVIDEKAVGADQAQKIVLVVDEKNIVQPRPVEVGSVVKGMRVIRAGLSENDKVIVNGQARVRPGMPVKPLTADEAKTAAAQPQH
jgi:RND family efflux transporter MFP subunit